MHILPDQISEFYIIISNGAGNKQATNHHTKLTNAKSVFF
jgi:hypothetical protein